MKKVCPICNKDLKTDDIVVMLGLAKIDLKEDSYDLSLMAQTITNHLYCAVSIKPADEVK